MAFCLWQLQVRKWIMSWEENDISSRVHCQSWVYQWNDLIYLPFFCPTSICFFALQSLYCPSFSKTGQQSPSTSPLAYSPCTGCAVIAVSARTGKMIYVTSHISCFPIIKSVNISVKISEAEQFSIFVKKLFTEQTWEKRCGLTPQCLPFVQLFMSIEHKQNKIFWSQDIYLSQAKVTEEKGSKRKKYKLNSAF